MSFVNSAKVYVTPTIPSKHVWVSFDQILVIAPLTIILMHIENI
jgi:hypothetical protein